MSTSMLRLSLASALLALPASADVLVVDASGSGEFTSLVDAVAAAADGDTLLVRAGDYRQFGTTIQPGGKSLVIASDGAGAVLTDAFETLVGETLVLRGLTVEPAAGGPTSAGVRTNGDTYLEACTVLGRDGHPASSNIAGGTALIPGNGRLVLRDCVVEGGRGSNSSASSFISAQSGGFGVEVLGHNARIAVYGGSITGGEGGNFVPGIFFPVGPGARGGDAVDGGNDEKLLLAGCTITGGAGGNGNETPGNFLGGAYAGGHGLVVTGTTQAKLMNAAVLGGLGGLDGNSSSGPNGAALSSGPSTSVTSFPGPWRSLRFGAPASEGGTISIEAQGQPGDLVGLFVSTTSGVLELPGKQGWFHVGVPFAGPIALGPIDGTGTLALNAGVPDLGLGPDDALVLFGQAMVKPTSGPMLLSAPTMTVLFDAGL